MPTFKKGVHPSGQKHFTASKTIEYTEIPKEVYIPLQQHIGAPCTALVEKGDMVKTGQVIGSSDAFVSSPVHSSITGKVMGIIKKHHPAGPRVQMIHIKQSGDEEWEKMDSIKDWMATDLNVLRDRIKQAGIVGLGGAAFPTHVKLAPPDEKKIDTFILNGCECEPYLTADHRMMVEDPDKILTGMAIIMKVLGVEKGHIGIEDNKPDAVLKMKDAVQKNGHGFVVNALKTKYPQGAEKMLIESVLRRRVPTGGLPMDVGVVVNNVGTALAVAEAVIEGKPLIQRVVTVTGDGIQSPKNLLMRIGTTYREAVDICEGLSDDTCRVFMGGPMMGIAQHDLTVPVVKATSGIVATSKVKRVRSMPCIRCGTCVSACPMFLIPTKIARLAEMRCMDESETWGILNCIECGSCSFGCPSNIPLVQWIRVGKYRLNESRQKQAKN